MSATTTVEAIAVASGYSTSAVASGTYTITSPQGTSPVSVNLASVATVTGIATTGAAGPATAAWIPRGMPTRRPCSAPRSAGTARRFTFGAAGSADAVSSTTIALPAGNDSSVNLLATAVNGNQPNQTFIVHLYRWHHSSFTQTLSDWFTPQNYAGESKRCTWPTASRRPAPPSSGPVYLYGYSFALNSAKTVQSITLPNNRNVVVLAVDVTPATARPRRRRRARP